MSRSLVVSVTALAFSPAVSAEMTSAEIDIEADRLASYGTALARLSDLVREYVAPNLTDCITVSNAYEEHCKGKSCDGNVGDFGYKECCDDWSSRSCEDADNDLIKTLVPDISNPRCCDTCRGDSSTDAYKAECVAETIQGPSVCGEDSEGQEVVPSFYHRSGGCSTSPDHELTGQDDDCSWDSELEKNVCISTCKSTAAGLVELVDVLNALKSDEEVTETTYNGWSEAVQKSYISFFDFPFAYVANGDSVVTRAMIKVDIAEACHGGLIEPYLGSDLNMVGGDAVIYEPTTTADSTIVMSGSSSVIVFGGTSAGSMDVTSTGTIRVANVANSGTITLSGASDVFVMDVVNSGKITADSSEVILSHVSNSGDISFNGGHVHAVKISNSGDVTIKAGHVEVELCRNTGSIVVSEGVTGSIIAPAGTDITAPTDFTIETFTGTACGEIATEPDPADAGAGTGDAGAGNDTATNMGTNSAGEEDDAFSGATTSMQIGHMLPAALAILCAVVLV